MTMVPPILLFLLTTIPDSRALRGQRIRKWLAKQDVVVREYEARNLLSAQGICEGECDSDADCDLGLQCFQHGNECQGLASYCHIPELVQSRVCSPASMCGICQGSCTADKDCAPGLSCFLGNGPIPGCRGTSHGPYCFWPKSPFTENDMDGVNMLLDESVHDGSTLTLPAEDNPDLVGVYYPTEEEDGGESASTGPIEENPGVDFYDPLGASEEGMDEVDLSFDESVPDSDESTSTLAAGPIEDNQDLVGVYYPTEEQGSGGFISTLGTDPVEYNPDFHDPLGASDKGLDGADLSPDESVPGTGESTSTLTTGPIEDNQDLVGVYYPTEEQENTGGGSVFGHIPADEEVHMYHKEPCVDGPGLFFVNARIGDKNCAWLQTRPSLIKQYCVKDSDAFLECKATCGACNL